MNKNLQSQLQKIPQQFQRQDSLNAQIADLFIVAERLGMYAASDAISRFYLDEAEVAQARQSLEDDE